MKIIKLNKKMRDLLYNRNSNYVLKKNYKYYLFIHLRNLENMIHDKNNVPLDANHTLVMEFKKLNI